MKGSDVHAVLMQKGISHLHHANTVTTSCSFLRSGGLVSRGLAVKLGVPQTPQDSDAIDQQFGIWHDIFTDTVDIHARASQRNYYGPVLFVLDTAMLLSLPSGSDVLVTKKNPTKWVNGEQASDRYYQTPAELSMFLSRGTFDQMIIVRTPSGHLPFAGKHAEIVLDNPQGKLQNGSDAYVSAEAKLRTTASASGVKATISQRACNPNCKCVGQYARLHLDFWF